MTRTITYHITQTESSLPIKTYLKSKGYSTQNLITLKKSPDSILVNGAPAFITHRLQAGDTLTIHIDEPESSDKIKPVELPLTIVYEDEDLLVVNKPAGMPTHPSVNNYDNSLANALAWYFARQNKPFIFRCINRLDKDTSGLTIIAKHMISAGILGSYVAEKASEKYSLQREYLAIVRGFLTPAEGTITAPISRKEGSIIEREVNFVHGKKAFTHYRLIKTYPVENIEKNGHSLVSLKLETGRTHQIRVHMKYIGFPLIGDHLYNPDMEFISRQALHSCRLAFTHPITGEAMEFTAPLPRDMQRVLEP